MKEKSLGLRALLVGKPLHLFRFSTHSARISIPMVLAIPIMALKIAGASSSPGSPSTKVRSIFIMLLWGGAFLSYGCPRVMFSMSVQTVSILFGQGNPLSCRGQRGEVKVFRDRLQKSVMIGKTGDAGVPWSLRIDPEKGHSPPSMHAGRRGYGGRERGASPGGT